MHPVVRVLLVALALHASVAKAVWAAPQRIVSLDLCTDWMLVRHADRAQVRALSPLHRQYPVAWIDAQWPVHDGTLEQLVSLRPDLVMVGQYNATLLRARLQALGVRVEVLPLPQSLADIRQYSKFNYGVGLRIQMQPGKNFRLDVGKEKKKKGMAVYMNMTEAF